MAAKDPLFGPFTTGDSASTFKELTIWDSPSVYKKHSTENAAADLRHCMREPRYKAVRHGSCLSPLSSWSVGQNTSLSWDVFEKVEAGTWHRNEENK